jgi:hypothetical protein
MDARVLAALKRSADYSPVFTERVASIANSIANELGCACYHDRDMNYASAQKISLSLDEQGKFCETSGSAKYQVDVLISSKDKFFTVVFLQRLYDGDLEENVWRSSRSAPNSRIKDVGLLLVELVQKRGYYLLEGEILDERVLGLNTEMDGVPATVFEGLFSELY